MMKVLKKIGVAVALLTLGMVLGALLFGPADIARGQAELGQFFAVGTAPSPCNLTVESRMVTRADGTTTGWLIALPPSSCTSLNLDIAHFPGDSASCVKIVDNGRVTRVDCEFSAVHQSTLFNFSSIDGE